MQYTELINKLTLFLLNSSIEFFKRLLVMHWVQIVHSFIIDLLLYLFYIRLIMNLCKGWWRS